MDGNDGNFIRGQRRCPCGNLHDRTRLIVVTGGPGAGKTAVLELARKRFCEGVVVLPEAATVLFAGGFPRSPIEGVQRAAQRAIFHVQRELEEAVLAEHRASTALCDRGLLDGLAYWPGGATSFFAALPIARDVAFARYAAVIHLRTPAAPFYNNRTNPMRVESADVALQIDRRIQEAWRGHPRLIVIDSNDDFLEKTAHALAAIERELPECCQHEGVKPATADIH